MDLFGAALGLGLVVCWIATLRAFPRGWGVSRGRLALSGVLLVVLLSCAGAFFGRGVAIAASVGALAVIEPVLLVRARRARQIHHAVEALRDPEARDRNLALLAELVGEPPSDFRYLNWSRIVAFVAAGASRAELADEALRWIERIDRARVDRVGVASRAQIMAAAHIALGQRQRAREVIAEVPRPVPGPLWERALTALETLLAALEGSPDPERAEAMARAGLEAEPDPMLRQTWYAAHAHALAALGRRDDARAALVRLRELAPKERPLERVVRHRGPASPIAEALLAESGMPYR